MKKLLKRLAIAVFSVLAVGLFAAHGIEALARYSAENRFSPEGQMVDVGTHSLHVVLKGEGGPTVIFESGLDSYGYLPWFKVQDSVSEHSTTLAYDRAGILWSEDSLEKKSLGSIASDLTALLQAADVPRPYIVVGHSVAGITLRRFIDNNRDDIAGIVLVDVSHPSQTERYPPKVPPRVLMSLMSNSGFIRRASSGRLYPNTDESDFINQLGPALMHRSNKGQYDEAANLVEMSKEAGEIESFGDIPLTVISATAMLQNIETMNSEQKEVAVMRKNLQLDLLKLSTNSKQVLAAKSNHYVQLEEPELVVDAIMEFVGISL